MRPPNRSRRRPLLSFIALALAAACGGGPGSPPLPPPVPSVAPAASPPLAASADAGATPSPPVARKDPHDTTVGGHTLHDDYGWLRDKKAPEVVSYLEAENAYTAARTAGLAPLSDVIDQETVARLQETDETPPVPFHGWVYYTRTGKGEQYVVRCRKRPAAGAKEVVLIDPNELGKTEAFVSVGQTEVSDDDNLYAYGLDTTGFRQFTLHVKDLRTGKELPDHVERIDSVAFAADNKTLFYVTEDAQTKRGNRVHAHVLGSDPAKDKLVYEEKDERFSVRVTRSRSRDFIVVASDSHTASEVRLIDARHPDAPMKLVQAREADHQYEVEPGRSVLYILTNSGGRNFRLVTAPIATPDKAHWTEIVPHRADVRIERAWAFSDHLVLRERKDAKVTFRTLDARATAATARTLDVGEEVYSPTFEPNPEFVTGTYRFGYSSPTTPHSVFDVNVKTGARTLVKKDDVPHFDPSLYVARRVHITARDGTSVPVSLVYKKGLTPDGTHPLHLGGYGAYGIPNDVGFDSMRISLLDRGVVCAIAHVRGGGDLGKPWHDAGRMQNKMNTFTDFIDSAEGLLQLGWAKRGDIGIEGRSAGGLLMGAVINLRPDLWRVVLAGMPFVDVMNTMLDESLPLTTGEFEEWGNPKVPEQFGWMMAYSPYDNVAKKDYPAMLVDTSYNDSQVMYWEPAKWVAKLRATKTDSNPLLLRTNMKPAGHGGQSGRYDRIKERSFDFAFLLTELGATEKVN